MNTSKAHVSTAVSIAVHRFQMLMRAEQAVERRESDLLDAMRTLNPDELAEYMRITEAERD